MLIFVTRMRIATDNATARSIMIYHPTVIGTIHHEILNKFDHDAADIRNISDNSMHHEILEKRLVLLHQMDAGLLFTTCFIANDSMAITIHHIQDLLTLLLSLYQNILILQDNVVYNSLSIIANIVRK